MLVRQQYIASVILLFSQPGVYGLDTETTGLTHKDRLFSIILSNDRNGYYFNFARPPGVLEEQVLRRDFVFQYLREVFSNPKSTWYIHNAKFDLKMLAKEGLTIAGNVRCTQITARVLHNNHFSYSLDACAKRIGDSKDDSVDAYIKAHKLTKQIPIPGKKKPHVLKFFDQVPIDIISAYGAKDAILHRKLGLHQVEELAEANRFQPTDASPATNLNFVLENEHKLLHVCLEMERIGIKINREFVKEALAHEQNLVDQALAEFKAMTGKDFTDSNKALAEVFTAAGETMRFTEKGNPSFTQAVLDTLESPIAKVVTKLRNHQLQAGTYYSSFLYFADEEDVIHAQMRQDGTDTGRFSYADPNLQNLPKDEDTDDWYLVRRAFVPRPGFCFVSIDYDQQEFRMLLDRAGEMRIIAEVLKGKDVHQATADQMGTTRSRAKTLNFGLLYGMGAAKLARSLKISEVEAISLRAKYFANLPRVESFTKQVRAAGKSFGSVRGWSGRRFHLNDPEHAYILLNHIIQGGCADVVKVAMVQIFEFLKGKKSRMVCQIHDELLLEVHETEFELVAQIKKIMENVYPSKNGLPLTCSVSHSWLSWAFPDKIKGEPNEETRNQFQGKNFARSKSDTVLVLG